MITGSPAHAAAFAVLFPPPSPEPVAPKAPGRPHQPAVITPSARAASALAASLDREPPRGSAPPSGPGAVSRSGSEPLAPPPRRIEPTASEALRLPPTDHAAPPPVAGFAIPQPISVDAATLGMFSRQPMEAAPLLRMAADDETLHAVALGHNARVTVDAGNAGELALHLRVRDGVADLRVEGAAAQSLDIRANEIRTALAGEGISLGQFENAGSTSPGTPPTITLPDPTPTPDDSRHAAREPGTTDGSSSGAAGQSSSSSSSQSQSHSQSSDGRQHAYADDRWGDGLRAPRAAGSSPPPTGPASDTESDTESDHASSSPRRGHLHVTA